MTGFKIFTTRRVTIGTAFADTQTICDFGDLDGRPTTILDGAGAHTVVVVVDRETGATVG